MFRWIVSSLLPHRPHFGMYFTPRKDGGSNVAESAEVVHKDLSENDNIGRTSDSVIEVIQADIEEVSRSCVYAITKHEEQKRVVVIFRGTSNSGDWVKDALIMQVSAIVTFATRIPHC
mmetsp:Transcript_26360/g.60728  ORF Transcript_26360/g.60728 Transcript_26360/m.60728 type:complete len:118 (-) Transcript_26360:1183-1536(-)